MNMVKILLGVLLSAICSLASSAPYPERPITLIVPFAPGGGADAMGRAVARYLERRLNQSVVVVNRPGAGGQIGFSALARAPADGYTLGVVTLPNLVVLPIQRDAQYKLSDIALVANVVEDVGMFFTKKDSPIKSIVDLVAQARSSPGRITIATTGEGSMPHLAMLSLERQAKIKMTAVPYSGAAPIRMAVLAGTVDAGFVSIVDGLGDLQGGTAQSIGVSAAQRSDLLPDVPTAKEQGFGLFISAHRGIAAPAQTPPSILKLLSDLIADAVKDPEFREIARKQNMPLRYLDPVAFHEEVTRQQNDYQTIWQTNPWK